jgi:type IV secretory pathway TraG/TraD family ATPase VirD4
VLDKATSSNDFLLTDVRKKKMTIYIGIQPNKLAESRLIINLFFSQLINLNTKELPKSNPDLKYQCLLLMDEFTSIGKVEIIASAVSYMAGYNIRLLPIIQSMSQLDATYGREVSHDHHQPRAADPVRAARTAGCQRLLGHAGLHHGAQEERHPCPREDPQLHRGRR